MAVRYKNGRYIIDYYPSGYKGRRSISTLPPGTTEAQAHAIEKEYRSRRDHQPSINPSSSIARLARHYLEYCEMHQSPETAKDKHSHFSAHIIPFFGHLHITDLTNAHITAYKQQMKQKTYKVGKDIIKKVGNRTISKGLCYLSAFLKWADEEAQLAPAYPLRFKKLPSVRPVPIVLSLDEAMAFINAADQICRLAHQCRGNPKCLFKVAYNVMFKVFFYLGPRNRAVRHMRWDDVDWTKHAIKTVEKGNKVKWHPLPDDLFEDLRRIYISSRSEWVFSSPQDHTKPVKELKKAVARARSRAGITKRVYPHLLRHSIATHLIDSDVDIRQIQAFLGHSQISTTEWYAQVSVEKKRQALEKAGIKTTKI